MYWVGVLIIAFGAGDTFKRKSSTYLITTSIVYLFVIIVGYLLQSKAIVIIGIATIFIAINILAFSRFSGSVLFPFVITFMGIGLILAGTYSEGIGEALGDVIKVTNTTTVETRYIVPDILSFLRILSQYVVVGIQNK